MSWRKTTRVADRGVSRTAGHADYAIGRQSIGRTGAHSTELVIWLPDSFVRVTAASILVPTGTPTASPPGTPPMARAPDLENAVDVNAFNTHEAMEQIAQELTVLR